MSGELADPPVEPLEPPEKPFSRNSGDGYNVEAGRRIRAGDRAGLERICRYIVRPPFCQERLRLLDDGRVVYKFRRSWPDGSTHLVLDPVEFLGKLAALIPPPRSHLLRYHGVLAPNAKWRRAVIPQRWEGSSTPTPAWEGSVTPTPAWEGSVTPTPAWEGSATPTLKSLPQPVRPLTTRLRASRYGGQAGTATRPAAQDRDPRPGRQPATGTETRPAAHDPLGASSGPGVFVARSRWRQRMRRADLLQRTMGLDVLACPRCGGRLEPIAEILEPGAVAKILRSMGLPDSPPRISPARSPPQSDFDFVQ
jgi:hypothetical protein